MFGFTMRRLRNWLITDRDLTHYVERVDHSPDGTVTITMRGGTPVQFEQIRSAASYIQLAITTHQYGEEKGPHEPTS